MGPGLQPSTRWTRLDTRDSFGITEVMRTVIRLHSGKKCILRIQ